MLSWRLIVKDYTCLKTAKCAQHTERDGLTQVEPDASGELLKKAERRMNKALSRFHAGKAIGSMLFVTLTTPEGYSGGLHRAWRLFLWRARRRGLMRQYFAVREWNKKGTCEHLHIVFRTEDELSVELIRRCWTLAVLTAGGVEMADIKNIWTHHRWCYDMRGVKNYLAKYLVKGALEWKHQRSYWYSLMWVFRGYVGFTKALWMVYGKRWSVLESKMVRGMSDPGQYRFKRLCEASEALARAGFCGAKSFYKEVIGTERVAVREKMLLEKGGLKSSGMKSWLNGILLGENLMPLELRAKVGG